MADINADFQKYEKYVGDKEFRKKLSISQKMEMYGLWCVASRGKCNRPKPSRAKLLEYGKWASWKKYEHLGQEEAKKRFVERARKLAESKL